MDDKDLQRLLNEGLNRIQQQKQTRSERSMNLNIEEKELYTKYKKKAVKIGGFVVAAIIAGTIIGQSSDIIQPGYKGVQFSLSGGLKKEVLNQGLRWHAPWVDVTQYPVSTETVYLTKKETKNSPGNEDFDINTSDGKSVNVDVVYSYHMEDDKLPHIFTKFRRKEAPEIEESYIKTQIKTVMQEVSTRYGVLAMYAEQRDKATKEMESELAKILAKDGIMLESFALSDVRPDKTTLKSLQQIADAQNRNEFLKREQRNKEQEMINDKIDADNKAQVQVIQAQAAAKEVQIKADAQAKANAKLEQSLTPAIIQDNWIKKWNGSVPQVQGGNTPMIQLPASK
jgi:regulator of protease activity HflC (stomatin/prohibitin superfamily)